MNFRTNYVNHQETELKLEEKGQIHRRYHGFGGHLDEIEVFVWESYVELFS